MVNISQTAPQLWASVSTALDTAPGLLNHRLSHSHQAPSHFWLSEVLCVCPHWLPAHFLPHSSPEYWRLPDLTSYQKKTSLHPEVDGYRLPARGWESEGIIPTLWRLLKGHGCPPFREVSQEPTWLAEARITGKFKVAMLCLKSLGQKWKGSTRKGGYIS